jgi:phosphate transport system substrate-binding protein
MLVLVACGPGAQPAAPTTAPAAPPAAKPTTPPAAAAPTAAPAAKPTTAPAAGAATTAPAAAKPTTAAAAAPAITISGPFQDEAKALNGAGATFPAPLYQKWFNEYVSVTQVKVNYQAIGSGGGIKGVQDQTIDFGASDAPMTDEQIAAAKGGEIYHIPTALGAIVPTYNLANVKSKLKFTGDTLAGIFMGSIQ